MLENLLYFTTKKYYNNMQIINILGTVIMCANFKQLNLNWLVIKMLG